MSRSALILVVAVAMAQVGVAQEQPAFLCSPVAVADHLDLRVAPERQIVGEPQTVPATIDALFLVADDFHESHRLAITIREVNRGFADSGTAITLRSVGNRRAPSSLRSRLAAIARGSTDEARFQVMHEVLGALPSDREVERIRADTNADLVIVLAAQAGHRAQGVAYQPGPSGFGRRTGFVVLAENLRLVTRKHLMMHEIGHTLGLAHHRAAHDWSQPYLPYGLGYVAPTGGQTVMATDPFVAPWLDVYSFDGVFEKWGLRVGDRNHRAGEAAAVGAQFVADYEQAATATPDPDPEPPTDDPYTAVLEDGYEISVEVEYEQDGQLVQRRGRQHPADLGRESVVFYFFSPSNAELLVKVLDACAVNGHRWVFAGVVTDLAFDLTVKETSTGLRWAFSHPGGYVPAGRGDTRAFPCR